jgi:exodeoxyribonuclease VII small subunit
MSESNTEQLDELDFEQAHAELKEILERLAEDDVPMAEVVEKTRRGKALEVAMTQYLEEARGELERIEKGEDLPEITIRRQLPEPEAAEAAPGSSSSADDIPF